MASRRAEAAIETPSAELSVLHSGDLARLTKGFNCLTIGLRQWPRFFTRVLKRHIHRLSPRDPLLIHGRGHHAGVLPEATTRCSHPPSIKIAVILVRLRRCLSSRSRGYLMLTRNLAPGKRITFLEPGSAEQGCNHHGSKQDAQINP